MALETNVNSLYRFGKPHRPPSYFLNGIMGRFSTILQISCFYIVSMMFQLCVVSVLSLRRALKECNFYQLMRFVQTHTTYLVTDLKDPGPISKQADPTDHRIKWNTFQSHRQIIKSEVSLRNRCQGQFVSNDVDLDEHRDFVVALHRVLRKLDPSDKKGD